MSLSPTVLLVILAMAGVTYATRIAGLWLARRFQPSPRVEAALRHIPGAVLISIVAPLVLTGGPAEIIAALVAAAVMIATDSLPLAVALGVAVVWGLRQALGA